MTVDNGILFAAPGSQGSTFPNRVAWIGYCQTNPVVFFVSTWDSNDMLSDNVPFVAIVP